ncbi:leucine--tRNA ligase [Anaerocolumna sp. AGMB13020]|uniref:leucine--tRNA ligase n=1 Tax=Anaerocolumna sp. AGMB13020 TaxID=3081750 RepID=UPI002955657F|nr:leucine--tRNA ligase [Anaerocolumna sp. AGMB13020]WOO37122.1 leucine--tRNA ligase [Anaerocolumna sp. AGMB13020]
MGITYSKKTDAKWQNNWESTGLYKFYPESKKQKLYLLEMFSYPSGAKLHLGHWWNFGLSDIWGRMKRMQGYNVFHPMGFDAFGLPAENYALQTGVHPKISTETNIVTMEKQLRTIGATYDWDYEIKTCEPEYYKWTQWIFLQLYKRGLAYRKEAPVNWCPDCNTVLANEQVINGSCERCSSKVEQKELTQWFFKITDYAEELLEGLNTLNWPAKTKAIQRNWIGRSCGTDVKFSIEGFDTMIEVYTTRVETLMGVTYLVLAPEHPLVNIITTPQQKTAVEEYQQRTAFLTEIDRTSLTKEKTGEFTGAFCIHPISGEKLPVWISDYVLGSYGTGAVMAVPAHDERDYGFAIKYQLPVLEVIKSMDETYTTLLPFTDKGVLINSGVYNGLGSEAAKAVIAEKLIAINKGSNKINYRLRDWLVSRQRYWGAPIPIIYCEKCGIVPVPENELPVELPFDVDFVPGGKSPLARHEEFMHTTCPCCKGPGVRETDTLDTFVCSSWYYLRYIDPHNVQHPWDMRKMKQLMSVDKYIGGIEHAAMHLLYARFIYKALRDLGYTQGDEPFLNLVHQGIILGSDGQKMSKSKGNTISPDEYIEQYGADVFRTYLAFGFSYLEGGPWSDSGIKAVKSFFDKMNRIFERYLETANSDKGESEPALDTIRHRTIKAVTEDVEKFQFNTAIARLMEFRNAIAEYQMKDGRNTVFELDILRDYVRLLAPFAPHYSEEIWEMLGNETSIFDSSWPKYKEDKLTSNTVEIVIQINSKNRCRIQIETDVTEEKMKNIALKREEIVKEIYNKTILKTIYIKGKLINFVVR